MSKPEAEIAVDDPTAPAEDSPAVTNIRRVETVTLLLLLAIFVGVLLAGVGMDAVSGQLRMTFGSNDLLRGVNFLVAVIGLFGISEILLIMEERLALRGHAAKISLRAVLKVWKELPQYWVTLLRSSAIGCWLGITPGGAIAASFMSDNLAKRFSRDKDSFGKGRIEGVFAPETAAHACRPRGALRPQEWAAGPVGISGGRHCLQI